MKAVKAGIGGSGAMGSGIAQVAARSGCEVVLVDTNDKALAGAQRNIINSFDKLVEKGKINRDQADQYNKAITYSKDIAAFSGCDIVIEAIIENLDVKKDFFKNTESIVSDHCILATNTSSLSVVSIAAACKNPSRVIGIHFFNPAVLMPLVEIIPAHTTANHITEQATAIINAWNKTVVIARDTPGFIVNRVARPYYGEAIKMYEEGIADFATIDHAMRETGGFKMGPFELMDFIGNDINYKVTETVWEQFFYDPRYRPSLTQKRLFEAGLFGRKSGRGYYDYSDGAEIPVAENNPMKSKAIFERIIAMLINEAVDALYLNIASRDHIEMAMTKGVNYPKGLLKWCDEIGAGKVLMTLEKLQEDYGDDRYRPSILLKKMHLEHRKFF